MANTFYLDMDGVVADWDLGVAPIIGELRTRYVNGHYKNTPEEWARIKTHQRLYRDLPVMPLADQLVNLARQYRDQLGWQLLFLTAVPKDDDVPWAFYDKVLWAQEYFPDIPVHFGPHSTDKHRHCSPGDILVDDRKDNCESWQARGGQALRVQSRDLTPVIQELKQDLARRQSFQRLREMVNLDII